MWEDGGREAPSYPIAVTFAATLGFEEHLVLLVNFQTRLPTSEGSAMLRNLINIAPIASIAAVSGFDF